MKITKKLTAALLCILLSFSVAGCYNADNTWIAKTDDSTLPIGVYIYYLNLAVDTAAAKIDSTEEVMKSTIDGKSAEEYIRDQALTFVKSYYWIENKVKEFGVELTDEEKSSASATTGSMWSYYGETFENLGISQSSFNMAYSEYNIKYKKVFDHYYSEGGEFAITKDQLKENFIKSNYSYGYMYYSMMTADENGASTEMTDQQKKELNDTFELYKKKIDSGYTDISTAASEFAVEKGLEQPQYVSEVSELKYQYYPSNFVEKLSTMKEGETSIFESETNLVLLQKFNIDEAFDEKYNSPSDKLTMMLNEKSDEFTDYVYQKANEEMKDLNINQGALNSIKLSSIITDRNKMGTLKTESSAEESSASSQAE